jgi:ParB family transcriptional regulator, chromosome partitioning protein
MAGEKKAKEKKPRATSTRRRKKEAEPESRGLTASELRATSAPSEVNALRERIVADGGDVLGVFRDPLGGHWQVLAALPISRVEPTPYQRDLSAAHVQKLASAIDKLGRYLDPVIAWRTPDGKYWIPNGHHRAAALKKLGARSVTALVVPEEEVARRILLLNTEKAHNLRERALEVARLAQAIAAVDARPERDFTDEFEEPVLLTLGFCYEQRGRFAGGAFRPAVARVDGFLDEKLPRAIEIRRERAARVLELEDAVNVAVAGLKGRGLESPYLKAFVVARIDPLRFRRGATGDFDETIAKMIRAAVDFDVSKVRSDQVARTGGAPEE